MPKRIRLPAAGLALGLLILVVTIYEGGVVPVFGSRSEPEPTLAWQSAVSAWLDMAPAAGGGLWLLAGDTDSPELRLLNRDGREAFSYPLPGGLPEAGTYALGPLGLATLTPQGELELLTEAGRFTWRPDEEMSWRVVDVGESGVLLAGRAAAGEAGIPHETAFLIDSLGERLWRQETGGLILAGAVGANGDASYAVFPLDSDGLNPRYERFAAGVPAEGGQLEFLPMEVAYLERNVLLWGPDGALLLTPDGDRLSLRSEAGETVQAAAPLSAESIALLVQGGSAAGPLGELLLLDRRGIERLHLDLPNAILGRLGERPVLAGPNELRRLGGQPWQARLEGRPRLLVQKHDMLYVATERTLYAYRLESET